MACGHLLGTSPSSLESAGSSLGPVRGLSTGLAHLCRMDTDDAVPGTLEVLSLAQLAAHLHVSVQTLYDLRAKGRGPRGFRVGPRLLFRVSEIEAWVERMESDDARRHRGVR